MDHTGYIFNMIVLSLFSLIAFFLLVCYLYKKKIKCNFFISLLLIIFLLGIYSFFPFFLCAKGILERNTKYLEIALRTTIIPYEKRVCYYALGNIYSSEKFDGNKAIEYYEKALHNYKNKDYYISPLIQLYFFRGDYDKVVDLGHKTNNGGLVRQAYIMQNNYIDALKYFNINHKSPENLYLMAALLEETGDFIKANSVRENAEKEYERLLSLSKNPIEYKTRLQKYKTVNAYKEYIRAQSKLYGFIN